MEGIGYFNAFTFMQRETGLTSQNNSLPLRPQNQDIQDTSSELLMVLPTTTKLHRELLYIKNVRLTAKIPQPFSKTLILPYNILLLFLSSLLAVEYATANSMDTKHNPR